MTLRLILRGGEIVAAFILHQGHIGPSRKSKMHLTIFWFIPEYRKVEHIDMKPTHVHCTSLYMLITWSKKITKKPKVRNCEIMCAQYLKEKRKLLLSPRGKHKLPVTTRHFYM